MNILEEIFIENGVYYKKSGESKNVFIIEALGNKSIGKLVMYDFVSKGIYRRTRTQYFINDYKEDDLKEIFVDRSRYSMIGIIGDNFVKNDKFLVNSSTLKEFFQV